jgi:membrane associated rhomboid family serine protease
MRDTNPRAMIAIGFVLVLLGFVVPFLMVIRMIEPNLALSFISHGASVGGLFLGILGSALYIRKEKH